MLIVGFNGLMGDDVIEWLLFLLCNIVWSAVWMGGFDFEVVVNFDFFLYEWMIDYAIEDVSISDYVVWLYVIDCLSLRWYEISPVFCEGSCGHR